jgi:outer membrane biosynthesis protein TonB
VNTAFSDKENQLNLQIEATLKKIEGLRDELRDVEQLLDNMASDKAKYALLGDVHNRLIELDAADGLELFWGDEYDPQYSQQHLATLKEKIASFESKLEQVESQRNRIADEIEQLSDEVWVLRQDIDILKEEEESKKYEFVIEREMPKQPFRPMVMPWTKGDENEKRFRQILLLCVLYSILFGLLIPLYQAPEPDQEQVVKVPERLVKLLEKQKPKPVKKVARATKQDKPKQDPAKASAEQKKAARKKVERTGLLAFKENFSDLLDDSPADKLGAKARITNKGQQSMQAKRSIVTSMASQSSGGINTSNISRNVGGTGKSLGNVEFARVESTIGTDFADQQRPLSDGPGPSRTDEEIQIVFDRYKAALYRIYNRELRRNPTLQGKMVLLITIEPNGSVSVAKVASIDMGSGSSGLAKKIVARVKRFNFGAKKGVPRVTIKYPIDFLPAS